MTDLLNEVREESWHECGKWSRRARTWQAWSVTLAVVAAIGSGLAGAAVAAVSTLSNTDRAIIAILAFGGAAVSGIAAAVGAPSQAKAAVLRSDRLAALDRWAALALVNLPKLSNTEADQVARNFLAWRDEIFGVEAPPAIRDQKTHIEPTKGASP